MPAHSDDELDIDDDAEANNDERKALLPVARKEPGPAAADPAAAAKASAKAQAPTTPVVAIEGLRSVLTFAVLIQHYYQNMEVGKCAVASLSLGP
jgi:hypothetical protein